MVYSAKQPQTRRILCVWLPNWPIQRIHQVEPGLKDRAIVLEHPGPRGRIVAACCARAMQLGIRPAMPLADAKSLLADAKSLAGSRIVVRPFAPDDDRRSLETLAEECERFSPLVGLDNADRPESLLLDITGLSNLFGSQRRLANQVRQYFERRGQTVRLAVADTIGLALAVANFGHTLTLPQQSPALVSGQARIFGLDASQSIAMQSLALHPTRKHLFDDALVSTDDQQLIAGLPVASLRIAEETIQLLSELGIEQVGQLLALPRDSLPARFGPQLSLRLDQLTGKAVEVITACRPTLAFEVEQSLEEPVSERFLLVRIIRELLLQIATRLRKKDRGALHLLCKFTYVNRQIHSLPIYLFQPSADVARMMELVELNLEQLRIHDEVIAIAVAAPATGPLRRVQQELFAKDKSPDAHELAMLVNRLSGRLGSDRILFPRFHSSALPERVRHYTPATNAHRNLGRSQGKPAQDRLRPLLLYRRALRVKVISIAPDGPPQVVWLPRGQQQIKSFCGPERIETGWWRGKSVRRDYYRIVTESGSLWWMFRRLHDGQWFLHGEFA